MRGEPRRHAAHLRVGRHDVGVWLAPAMTPMAADDDAQAVAQANVAALETTTMDDNPARELFEALLANPAMGAAEARAYTRPLFGST